MLEVLGDNAERTGDRLGDLMLEVLLVGDGVVDMLFCIRADSRIIKGVVFCDGIFETRRRDCGGMDRRIILNVE